MEEEKTETPKDETTETSEEESETTTEEKDEWLDCYCLNNTFFFFFYNPLCLGLKENNSYSSRKARGWTGRETGQFPKRENKQAISEMLQNYHALKFPTLTP